jgi:Predicted Rossmann fold nucleotide-binding protein involved in DNA uptake
MTPQTSRPEPNELEIPSIGAWLGSLSTLMIS